MRQDFHAIEAMYLDEADDLVKGRYALRRAAALFGLKEIEQTRLATAFSEIARDALAAAKRNSLELYVEETQTDFYLCMSVTTPLEAQTNTDQLTAHPQDDSHGYVAASRLVPLTKTVSDDGRELTMRIRYPLPLERDTFEADHVDAVARTLRAERSRSALEEVKMQNQALIRTLDELNRKEEELQLLNQNLERTNQELELRQEELIHSTNLKDILLDIITHDINNPVGVIQGAVTLIEMGRNNNEIQTLISDSARRLGQVLQNATLLSRVAMNEQLEKEPLNISRIISESVTNFRPIYQQEDMDLINEVEEDLIILSNPVIEEVFANYLSNGVKYAKSGQRLIIKSERHADRVRFNFIDFGETIPGNQRQSVFQRSVQLAKGKKRGRGLGLSIVKYIARSLGGVAGVEPNSPTGNIFFLELETTTG